MKKKAIMWTIIIFSSIACIAFAIILVNLVNINNKNDINTNDNQIVNNIPDNKNEDSNTVKVNDIVLNSALGIKITSLLQVPNIYSEILNVELEENGISNKYMRTYSFVQILSNEKYSNMVKQPDDAAEYILSADLNNVVKNMFQNGNSVLNGELLIAEAYDINKLRYVSVPHGFTGNKLNYVINVPYAIKEYNDKVEVYTYRVYVTRSTKQVDEQDVTSDLIYYDNQRTNLAIDLIDQRMYAEQTQFDCINDKIEEGSIDKNRLKKVKVTLKKDNDNYLISSYD